jgi:nucleoside-specific outer membrane channel protein Tsx
MIKKILASAVLIGATLCTLPAHAQFQDNSIRYWNSDAFREPDTNLTGTGTNPFDPSEGKTAHNIMKNVISFTHVDGGNKFGDNFVNMDILKSNAGDPTATTCGMPFTNCSSPSVNTIGAIELYFVYRHNISLSKLTKKKLAFGPIKDVLFTAGVDLETKNTEFAPEKKTPVFGPTFAIKIKKGFWDVSTLWVKEWNHNGYGAYLPNPAIYNANGGVNFRSQVMVASAWLYPFKVGKAPFTFEGFGNIASSKGPDGSGNGTKPETLLHPKLMYNFGSLVGEKHNWQLGVGYEYWEHKFGEDSKLNPGSVQNAPFVELAIHL